MHALQFGGAMCLTGSLIIFEDNSCITFDGNFANLYDGGIYTEDYSVIKFSDNSTVGTTNQDFVYRFGIDMSKVTEVFHMWIDALAANMKSLIKWPDREMIITTLPQCFI